MSLFFGNGSSVLTARNSSQLKNHVLKLQQATEIERDKYIKSLKSVLHDSFDVIDSKASTRLAQYMVELAGKHDSL